MLPSLLLSNLSTFLLSAFVSCVLTSIPPQPSTYYVHLIPHSHWDPGWLQTYDQYTPTVESIIDSVLDCLEVHQSAGGKIESLSKMKILRF
jgi:hypothetical protein